jgi:predicted phage baseplate assembly protein
VITTLVGIEDVRNPLPSQGGIDPEPSAQVRLYAPQAFRTQERAVTESDYAAMAGTHPEVEKAEATLRSTGAWHTMFVTVQRRSGRPVDDAFRGEIRQYLDGFRMAGYDLEVESPVFVPLDIGLTVHVAPGYFQTDVERALRDTFSNRVLPDGRLGFFHPDNFTFGQPVYLSPIVAAAMTVPGVLWVDTTGVPPNRFQRFGGSPHGELEAGLIVMARLEIARLDNDPNEAENGRIEFFMKEGL